MKRGDSVIVTIYPGGDILPVSCDRAIIMAVADGYAMLRNGQSPPFVLSLRELKKIQNQHEYSEKKD